MNDTHRFLSAILLIAPSCIGINTASPGKSQCSSVHVEVVEETGPAMFPIVLTRAQQAAFKKQYSDVLGISITIERERLRKSLALELVPLVQEKLGRGEYRELSLENNIGIAAVGTLAAGQSIVVVTSLDNETARVVNILLAEVLQRCPSAAPLYWLTGLDASGAGT